MLDTALCGLPLMGKVGTLRNRDSQRNPFAGHWWLHWNSESILCLSEGGEMSFQKGVALLLYSTKCSNLGIHGTPCLVRLPGTVLGIPGYLVSRDPWDPMPGGTTRDCPGYPGILSFSGSMGPHAWWDYPGQSWVSRDT